MNLEIISSQEPEYSESQKWFFNLLDEYPQYDRFWNRVSKELDIPLLENNLTCFSSGEQAFIKFLAGVWLGNNQFDFDIINDVARLEKQEKKIVAKWVENTIYP